MDEPISLSIIGCVVNGPGEARDAEGALVLSGLRYWIRRERLAVGRGAPQEHGAAVVARVAVQRAAVAPPRRALLAERGRGRLGEVILAPAIAAPADLDDALTLSEGIDL